MDASRKPSKLSKFLDETQRAYEEYLTLPTAIILVFVVLGITMPTLEQANISWLDQLRESLSTRMLGDENSTRDMLIAGAAALITVTAITFTVLLLAVQQAASAMSTQITDQFLRRPINQVLFGYFVGMSIYSLIVLASIHPHFNPILSTLLTFIFSGIALYFLAALVYVTLTQMRPAIVLHAIHDGTLEARERQLPIIRRIRRGPCINGGTSRVIRSRGDGYVTYVDLKPIERALDGRWDDLEIVLHVQIGSYVARGDQVAEIRSVSEVKADDLQHTVLRALQLGRTRDLEYDAAHGVEQIMNIGWTTISSAQQSPAAGAHAIAALRDLLAEWAEETLEPPDRERLPVVYHDDLPSKPLRALESLAVAATESRQHQNFALVLKTFADMFERLPSVQQSEIEDIIPRILSRMQDQVLTTELDQALLTLSDALHRAGRQETAGLIRASREQARRSIIRLDGVDSAA